MKPTTLSWKRVSPGGKFGVAVVALFALVTVGCGDAGDERDFLLVPHRPNQLAVIDAEDREVVAVHELAGGPPGIVEPSPDGRYAYVLTHHNRRITGIDIASGEEVFRTDFDEAGKRISAFTAMALSPDGLEIFVHQQPVSLLADRYHVEDTRIAVYDTSAGLEAKPVRTFPAERRTMLLAFSPDGSKLYAMSWDVVVYDTASGEELERLPITSWEREGYGAPDYFDGWPSHARSGVWSAPWIATRGDELMMGVVSLDLATGELAFVDVEPATALIFSLTVNPSRTDELFGAYTTLSKIDRVSGELKKRINLDHTYYSVVVSSDGSELYVGSTMDDIGVYSTAELQKLANITLPSGNDQGLAAIRLVRRARWD